MDSIAITGFSFKLPQGAEDDSSFWEILENRRNVMTSWPEARANLDAFYSPESTSRNTLYSKGAHFLKDDPFAFDAPFFSITSKEAASMDPQQRWLLEASYRAIENAGIPVEKIAGTETSVFAASMVGDYLRFIARDPDDAPLNVATGVEPSLLANRLSWYFDLKGPSIQLNTACSTGVVAMDLACQSLQNGQSSMALVAGSNVLLGLDNSLSLSNMNFLSPDSLCYSFDHRANGYARGEGVIVLVLKRLPDAIRDGDIIRAIIRGTGSNQDGHTPGLTQPSLDAQVTLVRKLYKSCNLGFELTRYVEAHGTGTQIGDSTEIKAIRRVFGNSRSPADPLYIGSVKANIGHLEGCSGLAGILKCIMILEKGVIPPNPLFEKWNPNINVNLSNLQVPTTCITWPTAGLRRVSVNSFGFGGSNGHIIMDDAYYTLEALSLDNSLHTIVPPHHLAVKCNGIETVPKLEHGFIVKEILENGTNGLHNCEMTPDSSPEDAQWNGHIEKMSTLVSSQELTSSGLLSKHVPATLNPKTGTNGISGPKSSLPILKYQLLIWSAKDEAALKRITQQYTNYYETHISGAPSRLRELAYTLSTRRSVMAWKSFAVASFGISSEKTGLEIAEIVRSTKEIGITFVFTGQGAQYKEMGLDLLQYSIFRSTLESASKIFKDLGAEWSLLDELRCGQRINEPQFSQPLCTALQVALVELLKTFNIFPDAVIGHSSGEIAAAYTIGALSLESACKVAYHRGRLASNLVRSGSQQGSMMSVNLREVDVPKYLHNFPLDAEIHIACVNSPSNVTLSGNAADIDTVKKHLDSDGIFAQKLSTGIAYHSPAMQQLVSEYLSCIGTLEQGSAGKNDILMVSTVTGEPVSRTTVSDSQYWVDNLVSPVRFHDALRYLVLAAPKTYSLKTISDYLEIGPHGALRRSVNDTLADILSKKSYNYTSLLSKFESPLKSTLETVGRFFARGHPVSVTNANQPDTKATLPRFLVDTPQYPFDHSQQYWYESRLSRDWRLRGAAPRSVLGFRAADWNPLEPRWRKSLNIKETPWLADHVVGETVFFPAAGSLMMAIEAVQQFSDTNMTVSGYHIKEATFMNPIVIRPENSTEVVTQLRPLRQAYEKSSVRFEVRLFALVDDNWNECFKALIHIEYEKLPTEVDGGQEARNTKQTLSRDYENAKHSSLKRISTEDFYKWHHDQGLKYGPAFAVVKDVSWDGGNLCVAHIDSVPSSELYEGIIHPTVLDAHFQVCAVTASEGMLKKMPTTVPHKLHDCWISASGWKSSQTHQVKVLAQTKLKTGAPGLEASLTALADDGALLCHIKRFEMRPIVGNETTSKAERNLLHSIEWKPCLNLLTPDQLHRYCNLNSQVDDESAAITYCLQLEKTLGAVLQHKMKNLLEVDLSKAPSHMKKYVSSLQRLLQKKSYLIESQGSENELPLSTALEHLKEMRPSWRMFIEIAENLLSIVRGDINVLDLLFSTSLAQDFYDDYFTRMYSNNLVSYLHLIAHQTPNQRILEVGAGTGAMTSLVLQILTQVEERTGGSAFSEYVYTDVSPGFFDKARSRFANFQNRMTFKPLDLERSISSQGLEHQGFDLILAGSVLHATKNLSSTLKQLHLALKPGGHLIIHETTTPDCLPVNLGFGVLPGWWCSDEEFRAWGPTITEPQWEMVLKENGFSGNDLVIKDYQDDAAHYASIIVSTAEDDINNPVLVSTTFIVVDDRDEYQNAVALCLADALSSSPYHLTKVVSVTEFTKANLVEDLHTIFLADLNKSFLAEISASAYESFKSWVQHSKYLLWVTSHYSHESNSVPNPFSSLKDGFLRTLRTEFSNKSFISLSFEDRIDEMSTLVENMHLVFKSAFSSSLSEVEFIVRDGLILTGRLVEEINMNKDLIASIVPQAKTETWLPGPPLKLDVGTRGSLETLRYVEDLDQYTSLGPSDIEIEAKVWGVNFRDVFLALGRLDENELGVDCAGVVTRVGSQCIDVRPGDRVCMNTFGCMRMYPRADQFALVKIPDSVSLDEACAVLNPGVTAWYSLIEIARLQKGEKILIHAGSGATGQLAIQVAKMVGAEVFATVGYDDKKQLLVDQYGIPPDHIFYSRDLSFAQGIRRVTEGYGVDVVLNSLVGDGLRASWECVAPYGRFIEIGKADIHANTPLPMSCFANNVSFFGVDLRHIGFHKKEIAQKLLYETIKLVGDGTLHCPRPLHAFMADAVEDAFRYLQGGKNSGRIIIKLDPLTKVQKYLVHRRTWTFDTNGTYIVAGGLGGIGRSILKWMAKKGAKYLIVPSRSGATSQAAIAMVDELKKLNITIVTPKCDVSSSDSLSQVVEEYSHKMPPIRGCINAAMVLNDSIFENMTYEQWETTIRSKVQSSWNLHNILPQNLDFFILLSSVSGIFGNASQSNYAAGCAFQDSLARYRIEMNQAAVSIDLGLMRTIGIVAETDLLHKTLLDSLGFIQIEEEEFLTVLDIYCDPARTVESGAKGQITLGMTTPIDLLAHDVQPHEIMNRRLFDYFSQTRGASNALTSTDNIDYAALFRKAETNEERSTLVLGSLSKKLARALSIESEDVDADKPLHAFGVDSLVAVELRNWIAKEFAADVPIFEIMGGRTVAAVAQLVTKTSQVTKGV